ncbi:MAG: hypothetical protein R3A10_16385 [Caldilineaceae bacterium]
MGAGDGQVDDDVDARIGQQLVHAEGAHAVGLRFGRGARRVNVRARRDVENGEFAGCFEVDVADVAAPDDADVRHGWCLSACLCHSCDGWGVVIHKPGFSKEARLVR